jgi:hypothetical protein
MPVPPAGMKTSLGASRPTRAGAPTLYLLISSLICGGQQEVGGGVGCVGTQAG